MSARMIPAPSARHFAAGEPSDFRLSGPGSTPTALVSADPAADTLSSFEDSEQLRDDLLKRLEAAFSLPWSHGGLNE
jgi:hypothetical protein